MNSTGLFIGVIAIGAGFAGYKLFSSVKRTEANLEFIPYPKLVNLNLKSFSIQVDLNIKNPSGNQFSFLFPHVSVSYNDTVLASSKLMNKTITVSPNDEVWIRNMQFDIPILNMAMAAASMIARWNKGETVPIKIKTSTEIHIKSHVQPVDDIKIIPVSKPKLLGK